MSKYSTAVIVLVAAILAGCGDHETPAPQTRPVRTVTVERHAAAESFSLTGQVRAQDQANVAFRLDGRMIERRVNPGDNVKPGQIIARLDPQILQNGLRQAQANLSAAQGQRTQARNDFERQRQLLEKGNTPRSRFDQAQQATQTAEAQVNAAEAQLHTAREQLNYTELLADSAGTVTAVGAEPGEVVAAGRMIVQVARQGGRDAVFDVPAQLIRTAPRDPVVEIALTDDPGITVKGRVREVAPQADPATRTFQVKVGLIDPPETMRLGATVTGRITLTAPAGVELPASALTRANSHPAVWVVDPRALTVSLRTVDILRYDSASVVVSQGLEAGETVVTAGVQVLHPGQKVRLPGEAK
ncbi:MAG: efflux RND transporter periplasmic adaptor subunit [Rhodospirillaceae bacterium]